MQSLLEICNAWLQLLAHLAQLLQHHGLDRHQLLCQHLAEQPEQLLRLDAKVIFGLPGRHSVSRSFKPKVRP